MRPKILPEDEIRFAAKTGFITRRIWNEFFADGGDRWRRKHWMLLKRRGFFRSHRSSRASDVLVPNPKNKDVNRLVGSDITAPPFIAQLDHDELMARSLLRLSRANAVASYRTEGELKRLFPLARNRYSPDQKEKYPDAIIETASGLNIALELELTLKTRRRYRQALRTYRARSDVSRIVFIVRSAAAFDSITEAMKDTYYPVLERPIGFTWVDDWTRDPMNARIDFKSTATSIGEMADLKGA